MKKYLMVLVLLVCSFSLALMVMNYLKDVPSKNNDGTQFPDTNQNQSQLPTPKILPIRGTSELLNQRQRIDMAEWREQTFILATANPAVLILNGQKNSKVVCLTFDDGPDDNITPKILDILKDYRVTGNFFFNGNLVRKHKEVVRRADAEGNLVLSHAYSHQELNQMVANDIDKEILASDKAFSDIIDKKPVFIRPPFGAINTDVIEAAIRNDCLLILWSIDTLDWTHDQADNIVKNVLDNVRPGDIILMHSDSDQQVDLDALPMIIEGLLGRGYSIIGLDEMLGEKGYK